MGTTSMDERLQKAYEFSNYRITLDNEIKQLKIWLKEQLAYSINGGIFQIDRDLINFVHTMKQMERSTTILLDTKDNPVVVGCFKSCFDGFNIFTS